MSHISTAEVHNGHPKPGHEISKLWRNANNRCNFAVDLFVRLVQNTLHMFRRAKISGFFNRDTSPGDELKETADETGQTIE